MAYIIEEYNLRNYIYLVDTIGKKYLKKMHNWNLF